MSSKRQKSESLLERLSVRHFLMVLWLTPIIVLGLIFGTYTINNHVTDITRILSTNRLNTLDYLSRTSEFSLFSGDTSTLTDIANSVRTEEIEGVLFISDEFRIVAFSSGMVDIAPELPASLAEYDRRKLVNINGNSYIYTAVYADGVNVEDAQYSRLLGYVAMKINSDYVKNIKNELLATSFLFLFISILILVLLSLYLSRKIDIHVARIMQSIADLGQGKYKQYQTRHQPWQLKKLYQSINTLSSELANYRDRMDSRVNKATHELTAALYELEEKNRDLTKSRQVAEAANRSKDMFLARMSHELRTPVNALIGFSKLASDETSIEKISEYNRIILSSSRHLLSLIDNLLDLSIIELNKLKINKTSFSLVKLLEEVTSVYSSKLNINNIRLITHIDSSINEYVYTDRTRLQQIFNNLISNSIKFTQHGEISILAHLLSTSETTQEIEFVIQDTGRGINKDHLSNIFKSFVQLDRVYDGHMGTGLGLAIVKQLVNALGGEISVNSTEGVGSRFSFVLNLEIGHENTVQPESEQPPENALKNVLDGKSVLIAEDHDYSRLLLIEYLNQLGINTIETKSGDELLEMIASVEPDLLLIDIHMTGLSGIEITRTIRDRENSHDGLPVLLMTADITLTVDDICQQSGADDLIFKPINFSELAVKIANLVSDVEISPDISIPDYDILVDKSESISEIRYLVDHLISAASDNDLQALKKYRHKLDGIVRLTNDPHLISSLKKARDGDPDDFEQIRKLYETIYKNIGDTDNSTN